MPDDVEAVPPADVVVSEVLDGEGDDAVTQRRSPWRGLTKPLSPTSRQIGPVSPANGHRVEVADRNGSTEPAAPPSGLSRGGSDLASVFDSDIPVIDLREVLAGTGNRRFRMFRRTPLLWRRWLAALLTFVLVLGGIGVIWLFARPSPSAEAAPAITPSVAPTTPVALSSLPPATTVPPVTTTVPPTTTTTTAAPAVPFIVPIGEALDISDLWLHWKGMGDLRLGGDADEMIGTLVATLGQPDQDSGLIVSRGKFGTCPDDEIRTVQWGPLVVVSLAGADDGSTFYGYRLDGTLPDARGPALELTTLSGLQIGDTVPTIEDLYAAEYTVALTEDTPYGPKFEILRGGNMMLWGPLTSLAEDGMVEGIFSAAACEA